MSSIAEAVEWLKYTYFYIRAKLNPIPYGIPRKQIEEDPDLGEYMTKMMTEAAEKLDANQMIRFDSMYVFFTKLDFSLVVPSLLCILLCVFAYVQMKNAS